MRGKSIFILFFIIIFLLNASMVFAYDSNTTENSTYVLSEINETDYKQSPSISINTSDVYRGESIGISLKDSSNVQLTNRNITANINNKNYTLNTDSGVANLKINLYSKSYFLNVFFIGDETYSSVNETFKINVLKYDSTIKVVNTTVINGNYLSIFLKDKFSKPINDATVTFTVNGKNYKVKTDDLGKANLKINLAAKKYSVKINFNGNGYYNSFSKTVKMIVPAATNLVIGNERLLTNGFLRIYLKSNVQSAISNKTVLITVGGKKFTKITNSEGIIIFKPKMGVGKLNIRVSYAGSSEVLNSSASKNVTGIKGDAKNPLNNKIPLRKGVPDIDYMTGSFVMADGDMKYTVLKEQYREVLKRDSYCLYLNKKLSKYVFFKSKSEPKLNHIIVREKWNVLERELFIKIEYPNKINYWPASITANLKGKSYTYSEIRDPQDTSYTCGPASASMCSQVLRNFISEKQFSKQAGTIWGFGTKCPWIKKALEKNNFKCSYFYKSSFNSALKQLSKGGCALIFHTYNHYVSIMDISKDGKKVLVGNPAKNYPKGKYKIPTGWISVKTLKTKFNNYDTRSLIVKLKYSLSKTTKTKVNNFYSSMGSGWTRQNTNEKIYPS